MSITAGCRVAALYDYSSEYPDDLSLRQGDTMLVVDDSVGEGWVKAQNEFTREEGLVPVTYIQLIEEAKAPAAPQKPPKPPKPSAVSQPGFQPSTGASTFQSSAGAPTAASAMGASTFHQQSGTAAPQQTWYLSPDTVQPKRNSFTESEQNDHYDEFDEFSDSDDEPQAASRGSKSSTSSRPAAAGGMLSRLTIAGHAGAIESFMIGQNVPSESLPRCYSIQMSVAGPMWEQCTPITCAVSNPKDMGKLMGMKKFVAYTVTPDFTNESVMRRYKHFDWLFDRLKERFPTIAVPALPDKQLTGHDEELVRDRTRKLKIWINRMCSHPVISQSEVFQHFLTIHEDKNQKAWKSGKRKAEKDPFKGLNSLLTYQMPEPNVGPKTLVQNAFAEYPPYSEAINKNLEKIQQSSLQICKAYGGLKSCHCHLGKSLKGLGQALETRLIKRDNVVYQSEGSVRLGAEINSIGDTFNQVGEMFGSQPEQDFEVLQDTAWVNCGILDNIPDIQKGVKSCNDVLEGAKKKPETSQDSLLEMNRKLDLITTAALAEVNQVQLQNPEEYRQMLLTALTAQVDFYRRLADSLEPHIHNLQSIDFSS